MNGRANCILSICCPARSDGQRKALADQMVEDLACSPEEARKYADWIADNFDLARAGTLTKFKADIARLARQP